MFKRITAISLFVSAAFIGNSQDFHFSQYFAAPAFLNPAMTGVFNGNLRLTGNYRNQWQSILPNNPFQTFQSSIELSGKSGDFNHVGGGFSMYSDKAGTAQLSTTNFSASIAYNMALSTAQDYFLSTGLQVGMFQRSINYNNLSFGTQYVNYHYDPGAPTFEQPGLNNVTFYDASLGILWYHINGKRHSQYAGMGIYHVNRPNQAFIDNDNDKIYTRYAAHGGVQFKSSQNIDIMPMLLVMKQGPSMEINAGGLFKFILDERKTTSYGGTSFYVGPYYRVVGNSETGTGSDAMMIVTKLDYNDFTFGLSYDLNISGLIPASSGRGGPELSIQHITHFGTGKPKYFCPKF